MKYYPETLWAGTMQSLDIARELYAEAMARVFSGETIQESKEEVPYLFSQQGGVGVIAIKGPLTNDESFINRFIGRTSYGDIRAAFIHAAKDPSVQSILMDVDSGGGAVSGVEDTASLISQIGKFKPVHAFTGGTMASAAYWLGASATKVYGSTTSNIGSLGIIAVHKEYSEQAKKEGVGVTVQRAGKYKALLNPLEKPTDEALARNQEHLQAAYDVFIEGVASKRGVTAKVADETFGQGREFFGVSAKTAGLVDGIESFDSIMSKLHQKNVDANAKRAQTVSMKTGSTSMAGKQALTEQEIAALAVGALHADVTTGASHTAVADQAAVDAAALAAQTTQATATTPVADTSGTALVAYLQGENVKATAEVVALRVELGAVKALLESTQAAQAGLLKIAGQSVKSMRIAMRQAVTDTSKMSADALLADHAVLAEAFTKAYPIGGVAAVGKEDAKKAVATPLFMTPGHIKSAR